MHEQVATVEPQGRHPEDLPPAGQGVPETPDRPVKFLYPGGARPLEGYTIKRGIGQGGFGEIYYAVSDAGKEVALKLIRRNLEVELRGIRHCLNLKHPNLLALFDIRQDAGGDNWVVMEYASGGCLEDALEQNPEGMPLELAIEWFHGIAAGVAYLHDRGIVHRDLKPGNVFMDEGFVKVGDYGLSKFISCSRRSGQTESVGTVHYMAPEIANGRYGKEIDIYALGIILYEMLTGNVPFDGESVGEVLMKHLTAQPDLSALGEPYRSVVGTALEKDPEKRFRTVPEMLAALPGPPAGAASGIGGYVAAGTIVGAAAVGAAARAGAPNAVNLVRAEVVDDEPVLRAIRQGCRNVRTAWIEANLATPVKVLILVIGLFALLANSKVLIPLAVVSLILYAAYRLVRMVVLKVQGGGRGATFREDFAAGPTRMSPRRPNDPALAQTLPARRRGKKDLPAPAMPYKSRRERFTELVGSLLISSLVALAMCVVMVLLKSYHTGRPMPEQCAWLVMMSIVGTWAVLIPSKFWEGTRGEPALRRFVMMVVGLGLGVFAFAGAQLFMIDLPYTQSFPEPSHYTPDGFYRDGHPLLMAYMACFGTLFLVLRWWRQADPLRLSRLTLWSMIVSVATAGVVAWAWRFPQPWLPMVAGAVSVSVQLASPWLHPAKRLPGKA